jgi:hypothetical protein
VKRGLEFALFVLFVAAGVGAAYNVMADNHDVEEMAKALACAGDPACKPQTTRMEKSPLGQSFSISTQKRAVDVRCVRALILAGAYSCELR